MARKGETVEQKPLLRHSGFGGPCAVVRTRRDGRYRRRDYKRLTKASAFRWFRLAKAGKITLHRDWKLDIAKSIADDTFLGGMKERD